MLSAYFNRIYKNPIFYLLLFVAVIFFIRCYVHEPSGDEVYYQYVWEDGDTTMYSRLNHRLDRKVTTLGEIVVSMRMHYKLWGGRTIVHGIEQAFTNHEIVFSVVNTAVFLCFIFLIGALVKVQTLKGKYPALLSIVLALLFLFPTPEGLWTSVNLGLNYLWPAVMSAAVILLWRKIEEGKLQMWQYGLVALLSFVCGWSHESFAVPLAAAVAGYYLLWRKRFVWRVLWLALPLWLGAAILFCAPGNFARLGGSKYGSGLIPRLLSAIDGIYDISHLSLPLIMVIGLLLVIVRGHGLRIKEYIKSNVHLILTFIMASGFALFAHTGDQSYSFVVLLSMIITLKYMIEYGVFAPRKVTYMLAVILTCLFVPQQILLARDTKVTYDHQQQIKNAIKESDDGLFLNSPATVSVFSKPFIRQWHGYFVINTAAILVGQPEKRAYLLPLNPSDYKAVADTGAYYVDKNKLPGNAPVYRAEGSEWLWVKRGALKDGTQIKAIYQPMDWSHTEATFSERIYSMIRPECSENTAVLKVDTVRCRFGEFYRIALSTPRRIKELNVVK